MSDLDSFEIICNSNNASVKLFYGGESYIISEVMDKYPKELVNSKVFEGTLNHYFSERRNGKPNNYIFPWKEVRSKEGYVVEMIYRVALEKEGGLLFLIMY